MLRRLLSLLLGIALLGAPVWAVQQNQTITARRRASAPSGIALVQTAKCNRASTGIVTCTFLTPVTSGDFVSFVVHDASSAPTLVAFNSVTMTADATSVSNYYASLLNVTTGGTAAVATCTNACTAVLAEFSGVATSSAFDQATTNSSSGYASGTTWNSGLTGTLPQSNMLAIGFSYSGVNDTGVLSAVSSPFLIGNTLTVPNAGDGDTVYWGYAIPGSTTAISFNGTSTISQSANSVATYKHP